MLVDGYFQYSLEFLPGLLPVHPYFQIHGLGMVWNQWKN